MKRKQLKGATGRERKKKGKESKNMGREGIGEKTREERKQEWD